MKSLESPKTLKVYQLLRQDGLNFASASICGPGPITSPGFFSDYNDAEMHRTHQTLILPSGSNVLFHVFELEIPNPIV